MDRAPPPQARRPIAPLAVAATVVVAPPRRRGPVHPGALAVALVVAAVALVFNSPLQELLDLPNAGSWRFLGLWAEGGAIAAVLGMVYRNPGLAWFGAGAFFVVSLAMSPWVWAGHFASVFLMAAVAAWQLRLRALEPPRPRGWMAVPA